MNTELQKLREQFKALKPEHQRMVEYSFWIVEYTRNLDVFNMCSEGIAAMSQAFPELQARRGWVDVPGVGERPHWWLVTPDGVVVDPTARQFTDKPGDTLPNGVRRAAYYGGAGILGYREVDEANPPIGKCMNCGGTCFKNTAPCYYVCSAKCEGELRDYYAKR